MNLGRVLRERIEQAKLDRKEKNCIGTALYLVGIKSEDGRIEPKEVDMSEYIQIPEPRVSCLAIWSHHPWLILKQRAYHMAVVTELNPPYSTKVTHRPRHGKQLLENQSCDRITEGYQYPSVKFYVPKL